MKVAIIQMSDLHIASDKDYIIDNAREFSQNGIFCSESLSESRACHNW